MGSAKRIIGGLLLGAGEGILEKARTRRTDALYLLQQQNQTARARSREDRADKRAETAHNRSKGLLSSIVPDAGGNLIGITRGGETKNLGVKSGKKSDLPTTGLSVDDKRELDTAIKRHTTGKGSLEGEKTDWDAVAKRLQNVGREDLAQRVSTMSAPGAKGIDVDSADYREAKRLAEEWASEQAGFFSSDKADFSKYGGNKAEAIQAKTAELYRELTGGQAASPAQQSTAAAAPISDTTGGAPPGAGSQDDPYQATSQADVDWFRDNAPAGSIIEVDGKLYKK